MPTGTRRRSTAHGSSTKTILVDSLPIEMISMMPSISSVGIQTCQTDPQVSLSGIHTISISHITKARPAGVAALTIRRSGSKNRRRSSTIVRENGGRSCKAVRRSWTTAGGYSDCSFSAGFHSWQCCEPSSDAYPLGNHCDI